MAKKIRKPCDRKHHRKHHPDACTCGVSLPWHLFRLGVEHHVCRCERKWLRVSAAEVVADGTAPPGET